MTVIDEKNVAILVQNTLNLVDARLIDHGRRVAYLVKKLLQVQGKYTADEMREICLLALLHDVGAYKTEEIDSMVRFETADSWAHSIYGYLFIKHLSPLQKWAPAILFHHVSSCNMQGDEACADIAQFIHLADRADVFLEGKAHAKQLLHFLKEMRGTRFSEQAVDCFLEAEKQFGIIEKMQLALEIDDEFAAFTMSEQVIDAYIKMLVCVIDFRSHHTATHTATTAAISVNVATLMGVDEQIKQKISYGALLHDMGKIGIPVEILEFSGKLSPQAMQVMRTHVDLTEKIMDGLIDPQTAQISLRHHEKLNGSGYPKGLVANDLKLCERIVAVADIVSALSGTRSYKEALSKETTIKIISEMAKRGELDCDVVATIATNFDQIMVQVQKNCNPIIEMYERIQAEFETMMHCYNHAT